MPLNRDPKWSLLQNFRMNRDFCCRAMQQMVKPRCPNMPRSAIASADFFLKTPGAARSASGLSQAILNGLRLHAEFAGILPARFWQPMA